MLFYRKIHISFPKFPLSFGIKTYFLFFFLVNHFSKHLYVIICLYFVALKYYYLFNFITLLTFQNITFSFFWLLEHKNRKKNCLEDNFLVFNLLLSNKIFIIQTHPH